MNIDNTRIRKGGMLGCCVLTLLAMAEEVPFADFGEGALVKCLKNSNHTMVLHAGVWTWLDPVAAEQDAREELIKQKHESVRSIVNG